MTLSSQLYRLTKLSHQFCAKVFSEVFDESGPLLEIVPVLLRPPGMEEVVEKFHDGCVGVAMVLKAEILFFRIKKIS